MKKTLHRLLSASLLSGVVLLTFFIALLIWGAWNDEWSGFNNSKSVSDGVCNVAIIPIEGDIVPFSGPEGADGTAEYATTNPEKVLTALRKAESDPYIEAVLIRIDSGGGSPVASEVIASAFKATALPTVALIREMGTSGAYLAATGADTIYASAFSDVGSIAVTMSYLENVEQNKQEGLDFVALASAPYKDYGNPNVALTAAERAIVERDLAIYHQEFVRQVAENRQLALEVVTKLADGSSMPGSMALENGLVDALGGQADTRAWFAEQLGVSEEEVIFCE